MKSIFDFFVQRRTLGNLLTLSLLVIGAAALFNINRDIFPKVDLGEMRIITLYPGASPEDVEINVTNKLEEELKSVSDIKSMSSESSEGVSRIAIIIAPDAEDPDEVKSDIRRAVQRVSDFPSEVNHSPTVFDIKTSIIPIIEVGISGDIPYSQLRQLAKNFEKKLEKIAGVSKLTKFGFYEREVKIEVDPLKMKSYKIGLQDIVTAIRGRNIRATGGSFESYSSEKNVVTLSQFKNPLEVKDVIVRSNSTGQQIFVHDLAKVTYGHKNPSVLSTMNGHQAISFLVFKRANADIVDTVNEVKKLAALEGTFLPKEVKFLYSNDISRFVKNRFEIVKANGIIGLILVIVILAFFLNYRMAFWVAMGIPVSILSAVFVLKALGYSLDAISLCSMVIVIGIIVDDAIIVSENIYRHYEQYNSPPLQAAVNGIAEVFSPVITTVLTTFLAFAPMFFMTGVMGKFVFVIPLVITLSLFFSLLECTLILPGHLAPALKKMRPSSDLANGRFQQFQKWFQRILTPLLKWRYLTLSFFIMLLGASLFYAKKYMHFELFPASSAEHFFVQVELPRGSSLEATLDKLHEIEGVIKQLPPHELNSFVSRAGHITDGNSYRYGNSFGTIDTNLTPYGKRDRSADQIVEELRALTKNIQGVNSIIYYIDAGGPPIGKPVVVRIVGGADDQRKSLTGEVHEFLKKIPGVKDIERDDKVGKSEVLIDIDYKKLAALGLNVSQVANNVRIAYDGQIVTSSRHENEDVDYRVMLDENSRSKENFLGQLEIPNAQGHLVPLQKMAKFITRPGSEDIKHFNTDRAITVEAGIFKGVTTSALVKEKIREHFNIGRNWPGLRFEFGGEAEETDKSMDSLKSTFLIACLGIYFLLVLLFGSILQPLYVMMAIPFGLIGVILAFGTHSQPLGFLAILGVIGLVGVVVNDSLVLVDHINSLTAKDPQASMFEIVRQGATNRLRAIILTTITTVAGLLPLAYGLGGTDPFMMPMALALSYGLLFATPLTLIIVPSLYLIGEDVKKAFGNFRK